MKSTTLIFFGRDSAAAKELAAKTRQAGGAAFVRDVAALGGELESAERVLLLPCVTPLDALRVREAYGAIVAPVGVLLPPPPPPDPLGNLPQDWHGKDTKWLRDLAASVSGRAVENKVQAIQVISQALAKRSSK